MRTTATICHEASLYSVVVRVTESYEAAIQHPCNEIHRPVDAVPLSVITPVLLTAM